MNHRKINPSALIAGCFLMALFAESITEAIIFISSGIYSYLF